MRGEDMAILMIYLIAMGVGLAIGLLIHAFICWLVSGCFKRIPPQFREMEPGMVWLLMIPCVPIVWNFYVYPRLARSFKAYFNSMGDTSVGDCGEQMGTYYSISVVCSLIPCVNYLAGPVSLVLLIINLVKAHELKNKIPLTAGGQ